MSTAKPQAICTSEPKSALRPLRTAGLAIFALACLLAAFAATGCSVQASGGNQVQDAYGRTVTLPAQVETAACVGSAARFAVYAGAQDKLVAITDLDKRTAAKRPYTVATANTFAALPVIGNGNHLMEESVDVEALMALSPDVIISSRSAQECDRLQEQTNIPVIGISYQDELFSNDVYASIEVIGRALGTQSHAQATIDALKGWRDELTAIASAAKGGAEKRVYVGAVNYKGVKGFCGTYAQYAPLIAIGCASVADRTGATGAFDTDFEQLAAWNPEVMFLNMENRVIMDGEYAQHAVLLNQIAALRTGEVYSQPAFNFNGTNIELGVCDAFFCASVLYPDAFPPTDFEAKAREVLTVMLGCDVYDELASAGITFERVGTWK